MRRDVRFRWDFSDWELELVALLPSLSYSNIPLREGRDRMK